MKGYSLRGKLAHAQKLFYSMMRTCISSLSGMSTEGKLACKLVRGRVNGDIFAEYKPIDAQPDAI